MKGYAKIRRDYTEAMRGDAMLTTSALRLIARRCEAYRHSHGDLPVLKFPLYADDVSGIPVGVSYIDIADAFRELAKRRDQEAFERRERLAT